MFKLAIIIAAVLVVLSLAAERSLDPNPSAFWVIFPGGIVGLLVAGLVAAMKGNAHGADDVTILFVASVVNYFCYFGIVHLALRRLSRQFDPDKY